MPKSTKAKFLVCVDNRGYPASLEVWKLYEVVPDSKAKKQEQVRVIDESGEDYLYPADRFIAIEVTTEQIRALLKAAELVGQGSNGA